MRITSNEKGEAQWDELPRPCYSRNISELPDQSQTKLHGAAAAVELVPVQEIIWPRIYVYIGRGQWVGVGRRVESAVIAGQPDAEVPMVESIVGIHTELQ
jgi:hypothetical protein